MDQEEEKKSAEIPDSDEGIQPDPNAEIPQEAAEDEEDPMALPAEADISADEIDSLLQEADPEFSEEVSNFDRSLDNADVVDLSANDGDLEFDEETQKVQQLKTNAHPMIRLFRNRIVIPIKNTRDRTIYRFHNLYKTSVQLFFWSVKTTKHIVLYSLPEFFKYFVSQSRQFSAYIGSVYQKFTKLSLFKKVAILIVTGLGTASLYFAIMIFKEAWLEQYIHRLPTSLANYGQIHGQANQKDQLVEFNSVFPDFEYQVQLKRVIVNLRRDPESGILPMGAFEFFLGLDSQNTAIEVRDREKEILDRIQRILEGFTYSEIMSRTGKGRMKTRIADSINEVLNQGRVTGVYLNKIVTNH